jgi:hypothetical protein
MPEKEAIDNFIRWLRVRQRSGLPMPSTYDQLVDEIWHSALLRRMLSGKPALRVAPPRSFGQPWYSLVEEGEATGCVVTALKDRSGASPKLSINETPWEIVEEISDREFVVEYRSDASLYVAHCEQADGPWTLTRYDLWLARGVTEVGHVTRLTTTPV